MAAQNKPPEVEVELKIKLSPEDLENVFRVLSERAQQSGVKLKHKFMPRAYYDTPDLELHSQGMALRVQYKPGKSGNLGSYEQTLKLELQPDSPLGESVLMRKECKDNIPTHQYSLEAVTDAQAQEAIKPFKDKSLVHIFTAAIERRYFEIELQNGADTGAVEIAFDVGKFILPEEEGPHQDLFEIEVEVKRGSADLIELAKKEILQLAPSAKVQPLSKADQGNQLYLAHKMQRVAVGAH